jgi:glutamyl/glutaminyl-tRNA synthetase
MTRFAPAPTGRLHLGHVANAIFVWGAAQAVGGRVLLRIEDHDRQRCRREFDAAILDDLATLGLAADAGPVRQSESAAPYEAALASLEADGLVYACDCTRGTFAGWSARHGRAWAGRGCPGDCATRRLAGDSGRILRAALGDGEERWTDAWLGARTAMVGSGGDLPIRDRNGNWTYGFSVVVDDARQGIDLAVRGEDLLDATGDQVRLGRRLGRSDPPTFLHHPLIRKPNGAKLSKADGDAAVGARLAAGASPAELFGEAAAAVGLLPAPRPLHPDEFGVLLASRR